MRKLNVLFCAIFLSATSISYSQDFNDYKPIKSSGKLPDDFTKLSSQKYLEDKKNIDKSTKGKDKKAQDKFYLESNFKIDDILLSGKILFNDPATNYVNKVADKLLENDTELRKKLKFYVVKSSALNAFATNGGIIFVNLGLLSQIENEAQLAFILSHEITHFEKKHALNSYVENQHIKSGKGVYRKLSVEERYFAKNNYSKEIESEADLHGLEIYLKSRYTKEAIPAVFNVLQYAYLPYDDATFDSTFFNTEHLQFPKGYFLEKTADIKSDENYDDSKSTHPNTAKRRTAVMERLEEKADGKATYLVSKDEFSQVQKIARYEICRIYLINRKYEASVYHTYLLLKKDPNSKYLRTIMAKALYGLSKYANAEEFSDVHVDYSNVEGASQQVFHFFEKIKSNELNVLALLHLWKLHKEFPEDTEIKLMTDDIFKEMVDNHHSSRLDFFTKAKVSVIAEKNIDSIKTINIDSLSKYDKIKHKQTLSEVEGDDNFIKYAFVDLFKDSKFSKKFDELIDDKKAKEKAEQAMTVKEKDKLRRQEREERENIEKRGYALGLDKVVIVNPYYSRTDERKKNSIRYQDTEDGQQIFDDQIKENAKIANLNIDLVDPNSYQTADIDNFNENALLQEWIMEKLDHDEVKMVSPLYNEMKQVQTKHGTKHFCWMGLMSTTNKKYNKGGVLVLSLFTIYGAPYGIYYFVTPEHRSFYYTLVFNLETEELEMTSLNKVYSKDTESMIHSHIYYSLLQIKHKRK